MRFLSLKKMLIFLLALSLLVQTSAAQTEPAEEKPFRRPIELLERPEGIKAETHVFWTKDQPFTQPKTGAQTPILNGTQKTKGSIFSIKKLKEDYYMISASQPLSDIQLSYKNHKLDIVIDHAYVSPQKKSMKIGADRALESMGYQGQKNKDQVNVHLQFKKAVQDFHYFLDERGERLIIQAISNALTDLELKAEGEREVLRLKTQKPASAEVRQIEPGLLEITLPSVQSLIQAKEAFLEMRYLQKIEMGKQEKHQTKLKVWLREGAAFAPDGQNIYFYEAPKDAPIYAGGKLRLPKIDGLKPSDYQVNINERQASFQLPPLFKTPIWVMDSYLKRLEVKNDRWYFHFPTIKELKVEEGADYWEIQICSPKELYPQIAFIDIGHGGDDPGAVRYADFGKGKKAYMEKDANFAVGMLLREKFNNHPEIKLYFSRLSDINPPLIERAAMANEIGADLLLSLHNNINPVSSRVHGTDLYYLEGRSNQFISSRKLSEIILGKYKEHTQFISRKLNPAPDLFMVKYPLMPSVIVESGYMSNKEDLRKIFLPEQQKAKAEALYQAILEAFTGQKPAAIK